MPKVNEMTPDRTQDEVVQILKDRKTFMEGVTRDTGPDYHLVMRIVGQYSNPQAGVVNSDELDSTVNNWLASGYMLKEVHSLGPVDPPGQGLIGFRFAYHFVRE